MDKLSRILVVVTITTLLACCLAGCAEESDDNNKKPTRDETEKIAFLFDGGLGGIWCVDEVRLFIDGEEVVKNYFESDQFPPKDWDIEGSHYMPYTWFQGETNLYITEMHEGKFCAQIWSDYTRQLEYLILPKFEKGALSGAESVKLEFWVAGAASLCDYACLKVVVSLPEFEGWLEAYTIDTSEYRADDYKWTKVNLDLTDPKHFHEEEEEE